MNIIRWAAGILAAAALAGGITGCAKHTHSVCADTGPGWVTVRYAHQHTNTQHVNNMRWCTDGYAVGVWIQPAASSKWLDEAENSVSFSHAKPQ